MNIKKCDGQIVAPLPHMLVAFGYGVTKKRNGNVKDKYFAVTDNGSTTGPTYEPYMRRKNFWNLHYGLTHE